jgi:hypothetical protein
MQAHSTDAVVCAEIEMLKQNSRISKQDFRQDSGFSSWDGQFGKDEPQDSPLPRKMGWE